MKKIMFLFFFLILYGKIVNAQFNTQTIYVNGASYVKYSSNNIWGYDKVIIRSARGITWVKIATDSPGRGMAWEAVSGVIFDGVPVSGLEIICPKNKPPCEGCGPERVTNLVIYVWGNGSLTVDLKKVNYDNDYVVEGRFINKNDPDGQTWGMGSIKLDPPNAQAGDDVTIRIYIPSRMKIHVGRVELFLPDPTKQNPGRKRKVTLNFDPDGTYEFLWTVPEEYFSDAVVAYSNEGIQYVVYGNKENAGGRIPVLTRGTGYLRVAQLLKAKLSVQGKLVPDGESVEWISNRDKIVTAGAEGGRGPFSCVWYINNEKIEATGSGSRSWDFKDQNVLKNAYDITAVITDANNSKASSTIYVGVKTDLKVDMAVQGRPVPLGGSTTWKKGSQKSVRANIHNGQKPIKFRWIVNDGEYITPYSEAAPQERFTDMKYLDRDSVTMTIEVVDANNIRATGTVYIGRNPRDRNEEEPEPTGPAGPAPVPPALTGSPSDGANPDVDWDNKPWMDSRVQGCVREYLQNIVLYMANERRKWENTGRKKSQQLPLFTTIDDWGRVLNQNLTATGGVDGNWDNPTHFVWSEFNNPRAENLFGRTVEYYVKYECKALRPTGNSLDAAINDLANEDQADPCQKDTIRKEILAINSGLSESKKYYNNFIQYYNKISKEINDQNSDPSRNDMIAYSLVSANNQMDYFGENMKEVNSVGASLIARAGRCQDDIDMFEILQMLSEMNTRQTDMENKWQEITNLLETYGVDLQETMQQGEQFAQQNADPNWVQDGGLGVEIMGDGIDNIADGLQDEIAGALVQGNIVIVLFDGGEVMDDVFELYVDGRNEGDTPPGGRRTYILNLPPGSHQAVIRGKKSDVGPCTYGIIIRDGMNELLRVADAVEINQEVTYSFTVSGI